MSTVIRSIFPDKVKIFINRNFTLIWLGQAISQVGDYAFTTTLTIWIAATIGRNQPWSPLAVGGIVLTSTIPAVLVRPLAGVFIDRWDKRQTMLFMDAARGVLLVVFLLIIEVISRVPGAGGTLPLLLELGSAYLVVLLASTCAQFFNPARLALIGNIVAEPDRIRAFSRTEGTRYLAFIAGPAIGALLISIAGIRASLIIDALSFGVSFVTIFVARDIASPAASTSPRSQSRNILQEFYEGIRFLAQNRVLMAIMIACCLAMLGSGSQDTLVIFFLTQNLHANASLYGLLSSVFAVGAVLGAVLATPLSRSAGLSRALWGALIAYGLLSLVFARLTSFIPALLVFSLLGLNTTVFTVISFPLTLQVTPPTMIGRVNSVFSSLVQLAWMISTLVSGYIASSFNIILFGKGSDSVDAVLTVAGVLTVIGGLYAMARLPGNIAQKAEQETPAVGLSEDVAGSDVHEEVI